jgi:hypothetical protein
MRKLFIITAFVSFMAYPLYILSSNFFTTWIRTHQDDPWNEYASEEDTVRNRYNIELKEAIIWQDTVRRESQQEGLEHDDIDEEVDDTE